MTAIILPRGLIQSYLQRMVSVFVLLMLMSFGLTGSVWLLSWAVDQKLSDTNTVTTSQVTANLREKQLGCLAMNIYREAGGEPFEGKVGVAQVTVNRANSDKFPNDICQVVYQKDDRLGLCQFSWYCQSNKVIRPRNTVAYHESMEVAKKVLLEGFTLPSLNSALYFHSDKINPGWKRKRVAKIGGHIFYE